MVAGSVKAPDAIELDAFFEGVADMRALLDRSLQDPERRRARLAAIASGLSKPRDPRELGRWLVTELAAAVGAAAAALVVRERAARFVPWHTVGTPREGWLEVALAEVTAAGRATPIASRPGEVVVPLTGLDGAIGALWLAVRTPLDPTATELLAAIAGTAGVRLEQGLLLESMA